jgi:hypothetical protein
MFVLAMINASSRLCFLYFYSPTQKDCVVETLLCQIKPIKMQPSLENSRKSAIEIYLTDVDRTLDIIRKETLKNDLSLRAKHDIKVFVFQSVNMLRTCLDYAYADIIEKIVRPNIDVRMEKKLLKKVEKSHFPYSFRDNSSFTANMEMKKHKSGVACNGAVNRKASTI